MLAEGSRYAVSKRASGRATQTGGELSFDEIFTRYHGPMYRYLLGMVGDDAQAQDLAQDTFLKVYKALVGTPDWCCLAVPHRHDDDPRCAAPSSAPHLAALRARRRRAVPDPRARPACTLHRASRARGHAAGPCPADAAPACPPVAFGGLLRCN